MLNNTAYRPLVGAKHHDEYPDQSCRANGACQRGAIVVSLHHEQRCREGNAHHDCGREGNDRAFISVDDSNGILVGEHHSQNETAKYDHASVT